jgi:hypothetical protein
MRRMAWYVIIVTLAVGVAMVGLWVVLIARRQVPELAEGKPSIRFHIAAELFTAALLVTGGIGLWVASEWAPTLTAAAIGAAIYSCIASPGYYADRGQIGPVAMFGVLVVFLTSALVVLLLG